MDLSGRNVAVLGAGGSGLAAASLALHRGASVAAFDSGDPEKLAPAVARFAEKGVVLSCGDAALNPSQFFDLAVISPGIDAGTPLGQAFSEASGELIGEIEFAYRLSDVPVIAITGTNGKTTTTSLIDEMLRGAGLNSVAAGNIGKAYSEVVLEGESLDWVVLEVSSFQLETVVTFAPQIAIWTNFAPDHMDRYKTLDDYRAAKLRLFERVTSETLVVSKLEEGFSFPLHSTFSAFLPGGTYEYSDGRIVHGESGNAFDFEATKLHGKHNAENAMMALAVADHLGLDRGMIEPVISRFEPPRHRCEKVRVIDGVTFINDSKSTNLHSLESALAGEEKPVVLIVGGKEKGLDFSSLNALVSDRVRVAVCIGEIAENIADAWSRSTRCVLCPTLDEAVAGAASLADPGEVVLFSPGTSSFDMFSGYEARGEAFREAVTRRVTA